VTWVGKSSAEATLNLHQVGGIGKAGANVMITFFDFFRYFRQISAEKNSVILKK
jgi:hypothetical protein